MQSNSNLLGVEAAGKMKHNKSTSNANSDPAQKIRSILLPAPWSAPPASQSTLSFLRKTPFRMPSANALDTRPGDYEYNLQRKSSKKVRRVEQAADDV